MLVAVPMLALLVVRSLALPRAAQLVQRRRIDVTR